MTTTMTRRAALLSAACFPLAPAKATTAALPSAEERIAAIERRDGGRLGVAVLDTGTGAQLQHRADERFPMCSTFKFLTVAAVLDLVDRGAVRLDQTVAYGPWDLLSYAPVTKAHLAEGGMTLAEMCAAALNWSDNTAANLLLRLLGCPTAITQYARSLGDHITRLDRDEPTLNTCIPGDPRDTTSPNAMLRDMRAVLLGNALSVASRGQLDTWLAGDKVGGKRIRAGVPPTWQIGDKTGSGDHGTANTIAILRPPGRKPILVTVYYTQSRSPRPVQEAAHAEIGRIIAASF